MPDKITNELILEEIRKSRQELKATIEAVEVRILMKLEETNHRINEIEKQCANLTDRIEHLEIKEKKNNIIIYGLQKTPNEITLDFITTEIRALFDIDLQPNEVNNVYPLGKKQNCPIKLELVSYLKKVLILENAKKLKGTNISVAHDMTIKQRSENKLLRKHLYIARQDKNNQCYIRRNKLYVNDKIYTPQDLEDLDLDEGSEVEQQSSSAPSTPTITVNTEPQRQLLEKLQCGSTSSTPTEFSRRKNEVITGTLKENPTRPNTRTTSSKKK